jgi:hypothetical protein
MPKDIKPVSSNQQSISASELLDKFSESQDKNEVVEILRELFKSDKIEMITDLSDDEISLITAIDTIAEYKDLPMWRFAKDYFIKLKLSKNRKSRKELIEAIKGHMQSKNAGDKLREVFRQ